MLFARYTFHIFANLSRRFGIFVRTEYFRLAVRTFCGHLSGLALRYCKTFLSELLNFFGSRTPLLSLECVGPRSAESENRFWSFRNTLHDAHFQKLKRTQRKTGWNDSKNCCEKGFPGLACHFRKVLSDRLQSFLKGPESPI